MSASSFAEGVASVVGGRLDVVESALDGLTPLLERLEGADAVAVCERLMRLKARVTSASITAARVVDESGAARAAGATSAAALIAGSFGGDNGEGARMVRAAKALKSATRTEGALARGEISERQAGIIADALAALPAGVTPEQRETCESTLLSDAPRLTVKDLKRRGDRIADAIMPDKVDEIENTIIERREKIARQKTEFSMFDRKDGTFEGRFVIPEAQADMLRTLIDAASAPRRRHLTDDEARAQDELSYAQRRGMAFCALIEHLPTDGYATTGGTPATLAVSIQLDDLRSGLAAATLSTGTRISAGETRRLACQAGIIPAVFGGGSLPLDLGRLKRLFSSKQRFILAIRDLGCVAPGCDRPPGWCEAHHITYWENNGTTNLSDGVLLCAYHHHVVHDDGWDVRLNPDDGIAEVRKPGGRWRRNTKFRAGAPAAA